ncbi:MAG: transposase [Betaproteobacteria bacterium]|nr:transposase [Betaproteobacteria bacterium]
MTIPHDALHKMLFSSALMVRDLVLGLINDEWLHSLDFTTLEKVPSDFVTDDLKQRASDVIWRVKADGDWVYLYLLIEFQRTVDPWMAVRVMTYVGLLYQDLIRRAQVLEGQRLPPVLPIVLYNGDTRWHAATDVADLIPTPPGLVAQYLPRLSYVLIEEHRYADEDLATLRNLAAAMIRFEHAADPEVLPQVVALIRDLVEGNAELERTFTIWLSAVLSSRSGGAVALPEVGSLKELEMALDNRFEVWANRADPFGLERATRGLGGPCARRRKP